MSAFDFYEKDEVIYAVEQLAAEESNRGKELPKILESIMEAVSYAITKIAEEHAEIAKQKILNEVEWRE